jgi:arginine-tRNA-protein transferase
MPNGPERQLGSFHQCYRLDGRLVAVGVLDLLPQAVSSVYFLYHDSIHSRSPGKLGALREIALAKEAGYRWWYAGYYIHSCPKMRYKIDFSPQYVLDPEALAWDLMDREALAIFDRNHYVSLSGERRRLGQGASGDETTNTENADNTTVDARYESEDNHYLFKSDMPGIPSLADMINLDMDSLLLRSDYSDGFFFASDLVVWRNQNVQELGSLKSRIAELVAAIGPDLMDQVCIDFRQHN